ncbi:porphobilinogen deaminase [Spiromyces aspiralis]|uniref:Porphobilinogen deaminase n=1 Tax=Spiromyces aspiralis TaxID=68401 RepID=A0ACC1HRP4_9FUNG|nr:porphobilinogen deaminase [Spiromyces aspiralis]
MSDPETRPLTKLIIGTRESKLALVQTRHVKGEIERKHPEIQIEIKGMTTTGDRILNVGLSKIGEKSLFTKELEVSLERGEVDLVVHALKDLPTQIPEGMKITVITKREDPRDCVIIRSDLKAAGYTRLDQLPEGSVVGTSSVRRIAQLKRQYPGFVFVDIRGNIDTRMDKLEKGGKVGDEWVRYSAIILAAAGIKRLGWGDRITEFLKDEQTMHAVGQGALAIECRKCDEQTAKVLESLNDRRTRLACLAERALMRGLEGGCSVPIGVSTSWSEKKPVGIEQAIRDSTCSDKLQYLVLRARVCSPDGAQCMETGVCSQVQVADPALEWDSLLSWQQEKEDELADGLGRQLSERMLGMGASSILSGIRN